MKCYYKAMNVHFTKCSRLTELSVENTPLSMTPAPADDLNPPLVSEVYKQQQKSSGTPKVIICQCPKLIVRVMNSRVPHHEILSSPS